MILILLAVASAGEPAFAANLAEQPGWGGIRWGDPPPPTLQRFDRGMTLTYGGTSGSRVDPPTPYVTYVRADGVDRKIGDLTVTSVEYSFLGDKLSAVTMEMSAPAAATLLARLTVIYGEPYWRDRLGWPVTMKSWKRNDVQLAFAPWEDIVWVTLSNSEVRRKHVRELRQSQPAPVLADPSPPGAAGIGPGGP